jgi:hypothetical protein
MKNKLHHTTLVRRIPNEKWMDFRKRCMDNGISANQQQVNMIVKFADGFEVSQLIGALKAIECEIQNTLPGKFGEALYTIKGIVEKALGDRSAP